MVLGLENPKKAFAKKGTVCSFPVQLTVSDCFGSLRTICSLFFADRARCPSYSKGARKDDLRTIHKWKAEEKM